MNFIGAFMPRRASCEVMKIAIASDHAGFAYKERIKLLLIQLGHDLRDFGTDSNTPVDYPTFIRPAAEAVASGDCERGIVLGGSGNGEAMVANKVRGVRCSLCWSLDTARWAREHNDANVLAIGERTIPPELALEIVRIWLSTQFMAGRHAARVDAIES
jgi:ribose 5-phosphate isomerase B